jgi:hypothetical protein
MKLSIFYESSWRNSFLDGSNNEPLPKDGRKFVGSMTELKKEGNFIQRPITHDTVMGVLNRLIGDQRKLYQARESTDYYFKAMERDQKITFNDRQSRLIANNEIVYIRNVSGSTDQNTFTGLIKANDPAFNSAYSSQLWSVLYLGFNDLVTFILDEAFVANHVATHDPISTIDQLELVGELKAVESNEDLEKVITLLQQHFGELEYKNPKGLVVPLSLYCSALYLQLNRISKQFDLTATLTKSGGLSGISKRGFTKKDFMDRYTTGAKKLIWGNPYILKQKIKGQGEVVSMLTKASGVLDIVIDISKDRAEEIKSMIEDAGVTSFYLGKKGLAYLSDKIDLEANT